MKGSLPCVMLLGGLVPLSGCNQDQPAPSATESSEPRVTPLPVAEPPLSREALILAVARAASDWAGQRTDPDRQRELGGRRFELKLRFGCPGDQSASRRSSFDEQERVLRLQVEPEISAATPLLRRLELQGFEAAEGFWVYRPWLLESLCPAAPGRAPEQVLDRPVALPDNREDQETIQPRIGIVQFYTDQDSRTLRRESKAYEATLKLDEGEAASSQGYDLVLSGRLASLQDGRVIACTGRPDTQPACVISARFDHVALVRPDGEVLAQWSGS